MELKKIAIVFGTRPEAIKMAPLIKELKKKPELYDVRIIVTAQHREMLDQVLKVFEITPDYDLNIMKSEQTLSDITAMVLRKLESIFIEEKPDMVLVHGDTTTSFTAALASYYQQIAIGHVEAGLRTHDKYFPFPEEANRQFIDTIADLYFVPTETTKENLLKESKPEEKIFVTGNTAIDAIHYTLQQTGQHSILKILDPTQKWILLTMHRRENYGQPMKEVFEAVRKVVETYKSVSVIMPVHLSPSVQKAAESSLGNHDRIHLISPLEVDAFHKVLKKVYLVLTDSGGLQEEAPALDLPVLVLRNNTERPEGQKAGTLKVIGTNKERVYKEVVELLEDEVQYKEMSLAPNPYGDGFASVHIVKALTDYFKKEGKFFKEQGDSER